MYYPRTVVSNDIMNYIGSDTDIYNSGMIRNLDKASKSKIIIDNPKNYRLDLITSSIYGNAQAKQFSGIIGVINRLDTTVESNIGTIRYVPMSNLQTILNKT